MVSGVRLSDGSPAASCRPQISGTCGDTPNFTPRWQSSGERLNEPPTQMQAQPQRACLCAAFQDMSPRRFSCGRSLCSDAVFIASSISHQVCRREVISLCRYALRRIFAGRLAIFMGGYGQWSVTAHYFLKMPEARILFARYPLTNQMKCDRIASRGKPDFV